MRKMEDQDTMDKKISCAIFDVDGTLLDSMGVWINIGDIYLRKKGYEPDPELAEKVKVMTVPLTAAYMEGRTTCRKRRRRSPGRSRIR